MELKEVFRPGWRMIVACVAIIAGPLSVIQGFWTAHLVMSGRTVPPTLGTLPLYVLPAVAVISLAALYFGELARSRALETRLGLRPSHRSYAREAPSDILARLEAADWRGRQTTFRSRYRGRWLRGDAIVSSIYPYVWWVFVTVREEQEPGYKSFGRMTFLKWDSSIDQLGVGDKVEYEGRIADISMGHLELKRPAITILSSNAADSEKEEVG